MRKSLMAALVGIALLPLDSSAQNEAVAMAAMVMWEAFDVPRSTMNSITEPVSSSCTPRGSSIDCTGTHSTSSSTVCRGVAVAYLAGSVFAMVSQGNPRHSTYRINCRAHRVVMEFTPGQRTTVIQYERSTGDVVYRNSIES